MASLLDMKSHGSFFALSLVGHLLRKNSQQREVNLMQAELELGLFCIQNFSISMVSLQMLWPQAPGEPWPSVL